MNNIDTNGSHSLYDSMGLKKGAQKSDAEMGQEQFMQLMLAQLNNQDPMSPMENGDFLAQIAQFSTVSGIDKLQGSFDGFSDLMGESLHSNQALQASTLVGRDVLIPGSSSALSPTTPLEGVIEAPEHASNVVLNIKNAAGEIVHHSSFDQMYPGSHPFSWDGTLADGSQAPSGNYSFEVSAMVKGERTAMNTMVAARVESVSLGQMGQEPVLNLANVGPMEFSQVREVR